MDTIEGMPERFAGAERETQYFGTSDQPNFYRRPYGDGWALVGDACYHKDPYTAKGITDAFHQADLVASATDSGFRGRHQLERCLAAYGDARNWSTRARYQLTRQMATQEPLHGDIRNILAALPGNPRQSSRFLGTFAGTVRWEDFFFPENADAILNSRAAVGQ